jgi:hypothetical protein
MLACYLSVASSHLFSSVCVNCLIGLDEFSTIFGSGAAIETALTFGR